jgi:hypothetical protein
MKIITLRKLSPEIARAVQKRAKERRTSISKAVVGLLEEAVGLRPGDRRPTLYHDLDALAGSWSREEAGRFERALGEQRRIDSELWR